MRRAIWQYENLDTTQAYSKPCYIFSQTISTLLHPSSILPILSLSILPNQVSHFVSQSHWASTHLPVSVLGRCVRWEREVCREVDRGEESSWSICSSLLWQQRGIWQGPVKDGRCHPAKCLPTDSQENERERERKSRSKRRKQLNISTHLIYLHTPWEETMEIKRGERGYGGERER